MKNSSFLCLTLVSFLLLPSVCGGDEHVPAIEPLVRVVDLRVGEAATVRLHDGKQATVKLLEVDEQRDPVCDAVRRASVVVEVNGVRATLVSATYHLPKLVGEVQIDCSVTKGYNSNGTPSFWGLDKDARLRLWPARSPLVRPDTFQYPVEQKWFATDTQMANDPVYVDGGERLGPRKIYYHSGLDIGGSEGLVGVVAATDALVVSVGENVLDGHREDTPVNPRYDVVYLLDGRGWYYRYSHLKEIDDKLIPGRIVSRGDRIGLLGKEGGSGGWSHLHFEIKSRQPSGKWGTQEGYAFLWEAYVRERRPSVIAVARPHQVGFTGQEIVLDGTRSWNASGKELQYEWTLGDGTTTNTAQVRKKYSQPGRYSEALRVTNEAGEVAYDFAVVVIVDRANPERRIPSIHPNYYPTDGIRVGEAITFKVRTFNTASGKERWDFGDGSDPVEVQSDGNAVKLAPNGYAVTTHRFRKPGSYLVKVEHKNEHGVMATGHLHVVVEPRRQVARPRPLEPLAAQLEPSRKLVYKQVKDRKLNLHLFHPPQYKATDRRSAFVLLHGGGWTGGDVRRVYPFADYFRRAGMVAIGVEYRLSGHGQVTVYDCVRDARSAVRYVRRNAAELGIDPGRIVVSGCSAGGHLAVGTALFDGVDESGEASQDSCRPDGLVLYYPVIDTSPEGYGQRKIGDSWRRLSPRHQVREGGPPSILFHGTADTVTPFWGAEEFARRMSDLGNDCQLVAHPGGPHGHLIFDSDLFQSSLSCTSEFLQRQNFLPAAR